MYSEFKKRSQTGNYENTYREGVRIVGGWAGAYAVGAAGAEIGASFGVAFSPVGAITGEILGGLIGSLIGYFGGQYASIGITKDISRSSKMSANKTR